MSHPLASALLIMLWFFLWILWFMLPYRVFGDLFSDHELNT
jgi:hypothetical protein